MKPPFERPPIPVVVHQHAEESAMLRHIRSVLARAPHVRLRHLARLDERIAAHLDGLAVAGSYGTRLCTEALERPGAGEVFALAVRLIDERDETALQRLIAIAAALPDARRGLLSALGWVSAPSLRGLVRTLLGGDAVRRELAIGACRLHAVDPGPPLLAALGEDMPALRVAALRAAGALGRRDLLQYAGAILAEAHEDPALAFRAAECACLLGGRGAAEATLESLAIGEGPEQAPAERLLLLTIDFARGREFVRRIAHAQEPHAVLRRRVIGATALLGDATAVPWLIEQMADEVLARKAGEAFTLITGADLADLDLERKPPADLQSGPNDDPDDANVALDDDESLPWPDPERVRRWWQTHSAGLPTGIRCFMGATATMAHCQHVLREGTQRQRSVAAQLICLLEPGRSLFPIAAPAWRQQRLLKPQ
ncbi:TIGR02270 family protein [Roseateles violae]|uniref:TIGR02270 family protein n=1 Tax=Roseateles violae TaxID=3058042 RepID=A0ABT8DV17_9BURK|nr:TIGR02270 family protein [Pelomonas sp. PFR6]MDN3920011.1 TIGR02270 family protein [Pelomonas sp. PFR6]